MKSKYIKITYYTDIMNLIKAALKVDGDVTIKKGKYVVDAKSIMGVMSLDLSTGITIEYPDKAEEFDNFLNQFS